MKSPVIKTKGAFEKVNSVNSLKVVNSNKFTKNYFEITKKDSINQSWINFQNAHGLS